MQATPTQVSHWLQASNRTSSIDVLVGVNRDTPMSELFASELPTPNELLDAQDDLDYVEGLLAHCTASQRRVISMRFGLNQDQPLTLEQAGQRLGVSRERARQLQTDGFQRIRKGKAAEILAIPESCEIP